MRIVSLALFSIVPVITAVRSLNRYSYAERRSDGLPELKFDEGWLTLNVSTNYPIQVYTLNDECWIVSNR